MRAINVFMKLEVMEKSFSLYRFDENREVPRTIYQSSLFSVTKTDKELSIICDSDLDMPCNSADTDLRLIRVAGSLGFNTTGVISSLSKTLADNNISFFAISTFETDYILIKDDVFTRTIDSLEKDGFEIKSNIP